MHRGPSVDPTVPASSASGAAPRPRGAGPSRSRSCAILPLLLAACALSAQPPAAGPEPGVQHAALERNGAVIRDVRVRVDNIFNEDNPEEDRALYRWANRVHINTRPGVVENILLFAPGDAFDQRLLQESARLLRERPFVAEAVIEVSRYDEAANAVDIDVWVRDAWSFTPELKLGREGGENEYRLGLSDSNLLGTGKHLTVYYNSDVDRHERYVRFLDPNLAGTRNRIEAVLADASDGHRFVLGAEHPFYALDSRWAAGGRLVDHERIDSMYDLGEVVDEFRHDRRSAEIQGGWSRGLVDGRVRRWLAGFTFEESRFSPTVAAPDPLLLPPNRKLAYPWIGFQLLEDDYREMTELEDMGRVEDVPLGLNVFALLGFAADAFGADRSALIARAAASKGWELEEGQLLMFEASASGRHEDDALRNAVLETDLRYYHRNLEKHLFLVNLHALLSEELDLESQVLLGGDSGLRGFPLRYQSGQHRAVLTLEQRFHTDWYPLRLFRVGWAAFFDAGRVWGRDPRGTASQGMLYDVGVGLRLRSPRSSGRSIIHIDLAFPLNGDSSISSVQLSVETKQSF